MISWIQKYFQRHFRTIFAVMLIIMVVPLIWVFNPSSGTRGSDHNFVERHVFGYNLSSQQDSSRLFNDASLSGQLQSGYPPEGADLQNYAFQRAASLALADQLHLPQPSTQEITDFIKKLRVFSGQDGQFDPARYASFRDSLKSSPTLNEARVSRVLSDDVRAAKVQQLLAGPGYVLPSDVKFQLEQADATWTLGVATVDYASFNPTIPVNDAVLTKFFEENSFRYEIQPRVVVSYADFSALSLLPTITVNDAEVRAFYESNPSRYPKPPVTTKPGTPAVASREADFAAVRPKVETDLKLDKARRAAMKAASDLSYALYTQKLVPGTPAFDDFVASQKISVKPLAPFTREQGPAELGGSQEIATEAFKLNSERRFSDAVESPTGAVVLFWKETQPARKPLLAEVRAKVEADYIDGEKRKKFVELGREVRATIDARLKAGDTFEKAVAAAASAHSVKIDAKMLPAFTRRQPPQDIDYSVFGTLERLDKGHLSDMVIAKDHGLIVYAADKKLPNLTESNPQFAATRAQIAAATARIGAGSYLNQLIADELKKSEPVVK